MNYQSSSFSRRRPILKVGVPWASRLHILVDLTSTSAAMLAAEAGQASSPQPYAIAALNHDDLGHSNGPDRMNEERGQYNSSQARRLRWTLANYLPAAICAHLNKYPPGHSCSDCHRPLDHYDSRSILARQQASEGTRLLGVPSGAYRDVEEQLRHDDGRGIVKKTARIWMTIILVLGLAAAAVVVVIGVVFWPFAR